MTIMVPEECIDTSSVAQTLHQNLYNQLGPYYKIIQHIKVLDKKTALNGSLFWIQFKQQSLFVYLNDAPADYFNISNTEESNQKAIKEKLLSDPDFIALTDFQSRLLPAKLQNYKAQLTPILIFFNNVKNDSLNLGIKSLGIYLFGKEKTSSSSNLNSLINQYMGKPLSNTVFHHLRCTFNPELAVFSHQVDNSLLDAEQEMAMKVGMLLSKKKRRSDHLNLQGVNGGTNSGKSEVILQRAKLINQILKEESLNKKVLILTPSNVSQTSLNKRYYALAPTDKETEILSFNQWCGKLLGTTKRLVAEDEITELVNRVVENRLRENDISVNIFLQELNFILGRAIFYEKDYLNTKKGDRSYHLSKDQYKHIWKALLTIKSELAISDRLLCTELPQLLWDSLQNSSFDNYYDHILIDDAQLFPPIAFELMKKVIRPGSGQLFIAQDPNQHFANACSLWKDTGLDLRGHSMRLMNNYQINPYILNAASSFYLHRLPDGLDKTIHRNLPDISKNPMPQLLHFHSSQDEENRLLDKIKKLVLSGVSVKDILVISSQDEAVAHYEKIISETLGVAVERTGVSHHRKDLGICNLQQANGQIASYVFVIGLQSIFNDENRLKNSGNYSPDKYQALIIENTHKITSAMTCAKKELTLFITAEAIPREFISPHISSPNTNTESYAEVLSLHG